MKNRIYAKCMLVVFFLTVALGGYVHAASLKDSDIRNFISSMQEIQLLEEEYDDLDDIEEELDPLSEEDMQMPEKPISESMDRLKGHEIYNRIQGIAQSHGFANVEQWANVGDRVLKAFFSILLEDEEPAMRAELERSLREIDQNPHMTEAQKEEMKKMMTGAMSSIDAMADAPGDDIKAVRPHMEELRRTLEHMDDEEE